MENAMEVRLDAREAHVDAQGAEDPAPPPRRRRVARGPRRPVYLEPGSDRVMIALLALMSEVSALRDRIDTHERLAGQGAQASVEQVESFAPTAALAARRKAERRRMIDRVLRVLLEVADETDPGEASSPGDPLGA